ncbi:iron ABC transporter ATP-binding protein [Leifsonia xyli subsp. xyli]|uniref:Iron ABC transporter ATP-binding protein n=1 Tax=Leifsonia xyli subsp. xyli TaxID=59736 RepID=A0A1E2SLG2_LEIXY|nr:hypothetical protein [Leifsonia xyli]ODA90560.1 iron ABC transporter ATP-binding protein [Leifsonia xyli subsp. xyli]
MKKHPARIIAATIALASAAALAGCAPTPAPTSTPGKTANAKTAPAAPATPAAAPTDPPTPLAIACDALVTAQQLYAFNPNVGSAPDYSPKTGSLEKRIAEWKGTACAWQNQTSDQLIEIAVARPPANQLEGLKNAAITDAQPVPTYGAPPIEGYFKAGTSGQVQIFRGTEWIVAESAAFFEPGDAAQLMANVLANIPAS